MIPGRSSPNLRTAVLLVVLPCLPATVGCSRYVDGVPAAAETGTFPESSADLGALVVGEVPSGLPRLPDQELEPPAGAKAVDDIADYSDDPARERDVLEGYGYRHGWERFWGTGSGPMTGVFVDQFESRAGAGAYAEDLARNDAEHYDGVLHENPAELPGGCRMLTVDDADGQEALGGPAALAWCGHGRFSVAVTSVADSLGAAEEEVRAVVEAQLDRLPP
ncbi:hypothetical protein [Blastococcus sp. CT_GayMR16]|uniref:hypothetical protein n=1 Tax=Blastococcus sp. CT_GayMR16 TaxID=2559607 RepID=UPI0010743645|nr:hypothetical protein [Blastococcus sp. CT_GayMR16]TFV89059.1 hypothetical protein E4P38_07810 [Blastococcus sp. CT_GayMR16]